jgi:acyl carrier protein
MRHLLVNEILDATRASGPTEQTVRAACATVLSLNVGDVEDTIPLSSYGLDSLTSVRLSGILKTYFDITVTQLQLLSSHTTGENQHSLIAKGDTDYNYSGEVTQDARGAKASDYFGCKRNDRFLEARFGVKYR